MSPDSILEPQAWDARYGWDVVREHVGGIDATVVVTSPSAWAAVSDRFDGEPCHIEHAVGMRNAYLQETIPRLPDADMVLGIGGGNALDVAKYAAWRMQRPLILIPTIVSTGSVFQPTVAVRHPETWEWKTIISPRFVLFDFSVIRAAPSRLNCAGMAECICNLAPIGAWWWWDRQGHAGRAWDGKAADATVAWVEQCVSTFQDDLDAEGQPGPDGIRIAAEINRQRYDLATWWPKEMRGLDHVFVIAFEWVHQRELLHGEGIALGTLISNYLYGWRFETTKALLEGCRVCFRPEEIGCTHDEVRATLDRVDEVASKVGMAENWFRHQALDDATFDRMMTAIAS